MARSAVVIWLHGLGDTGPANASIPSFMKSPRLSAPAANWRFPTAPSQPVTCNYGAVMTSWFDLPEIPITSASPNCEDKVLKAVKSVHEMIDEEIEQGTDPSNIFLCGFSQGGALTLASSLLYPKTLAGAAVLSGWVPLNSDTFVSMAQENSTKRTPVLWLHGTDDQVVHFEAGKAGPPLLAKVGMPCEFKAYPRLGHTISPQELAHLEDWLHHRLD